MEVFGGEEVGEIRSRGVKRKWKEELAEHGGSVKEVG